ncbi:MAG: SGNH/GDSL hydrolase family protein [Coriobacteriia bacterium]|nr:SGNH/GDSL hydrolase family protein [Coriobacteriia bacterium]
MRPADTSSREERDATAPAAGILVRVDPPRGFRPFLIALGLLVVLDLLLRTPLYPSGFPEDFRVPKDTLMAYEAFTSWAGGRGGLQVAVVGDSVIEGHLVPAAETLSARLDQRYEDAGRDVHVHNLGLRGAHAVDLLGQVAYLAERGRADLLLVQFDYIYYGDDEPVGVHYPELFALARDIAPIDPAALPDAVRAELREKAAGASPAERADDALGRVWRLWRERERIDAVLFGGRPSVAMETALRDRARAALDEPGARQLRPDELDPDNLERFFGGGRFGEENPHLRYLELALAKAGHEGVPVVVFNNPLYFEGLAYHGALDMEVYRANVTVVRELVESHGGTFVDLAEGFPQEMMLDTAHLLPEGHAEAARRLEAAIEPLVTELDRERAGRRPAMPEGGERR